MVNGSAGAAGWHLDGRIPRDAARQLLRVRQREGGGELARRGLAVTSATWVSPSSSARCGAERDAHGLVQETAGQPLGSESIRVQPHGALQ